VLLARQKHLSTSKGHSGQKKRNWPVYKYDGLALWAAIHEDSITQSNVVQSFNDDIHKTLVAGRLRLTALKPPRDAMKVEGNDLMSVSPGKGPKTASKSIDQILSGFALDKIQ
jgi:hypothetical protein